MLRISGNWFPSIITRQGRIRGRGMERKQVIARLLGEIDLSTKAGYMIILLQGDSPGNGISSRTA
jgi:hypothetical protein